jgi:hypothetical protein
MRTTLDETGVEQRLRGEGIQLPSVQRKRALDERERLHQPVLGQEEAGVVAVGMGALGVQIEDAPVEFLRLVR